MGATKRVSNGREGVICWEKTDLINPELPLPHPQREVSALAAQPSQPCENQGQQGKWPGPAGVSSNAALVSSEQLSMELHQVEREIGKRTREMDMVRGMD